MHAFRSLCFFSVTLLIAVSLYAQVPQKISYQGYLTDAAGVPLEGAVMLQVFLYNDIAAGFSSWAEVHNTTVTKGIYNIVLGSVTPLTLAFDVPYFIGVSVNGGAELSPRTPLLSAPYAMRAAVADKFPSTISGLTTLNLTGTTVIGLSGGNRFSQSATGLAVSVSASASAGVEVQMSGVNVDPGLVVNTLAGGTTTGDLMQLQVAGTPVFQVSSAGDLSINNKFKVTAANGSLSMGGATPVIVMSGTSGQTTISDATTTNGFTLNVSNTAGGVTGSSTAGAATFTSAMRNGFAVVASRTANGSTFSATNASLGVSRGAMIDSLTLPASNGYVNFNGGNIMMQNALVNFTGSTITGLSSGNLFSQNLTAANVSITGSTNAAIEVQMSGNNVDPAILANSATGGATGDLLQLQKSGATVMKVSSTGNVTATVTAGVAITGTSSAGDAISGTSQANNGYGVHGSSTGGQTSAGVFGESMLGRAGSFVISNPASSNYALVAETNGQGNALLANYTGPVAVSTQVLGNIAIFQSNGANQARIDKTGKGFFNGGTQNNGADVAEAFDVEETSSAYTPGDVLVISTKSDRRVEKSDHAYCKLVAGVYATKPGVLLTPMDINENLGAKIPVGVVGILPTNVTSENGPIHRGDLLVTSSLAGHAMRASRSHLRPGTVIGKALQNFEGPGEGKIEVLVNTK